MGKKAKKKIARTGSPVTTAIKKTVVKKKESLWPWIFALAGITAICFFPMLKNGFTNWDDQYYVINNAMLRGPDWNAIFTQPVAANYHPLTMLTLAVNYQLSGLDPSSYLWFNLLLHLFNTALVFYFICKITDKKIAVAFLVALLFGIHPMHVESVAWVSERKDVLYTFFFLLTLIKYWNYLQTGKRSDFWVCLLFFILSLLSKPAAIVFPLVVFLLDYWKGRPINKKAILEKLPFFLLAIAFAVITFEVQSSKAMAQLSVFPLWTRFFFACYGIMIYFLRFFAPYPLSSFHPFPSVHDLGWAVYVSPLFVIASLLFLWFQRKNKIIVFGSLFYVVNLLLVLQIISVGLTIVSERYTYVPYIGLAFIAAMLLNKTRFGIDQKLKWAVPVLITVVFGAISFLRTGAWKNSGTLWSNVIKHYPNAPYARTNRANYTIPLAQTMTDPARKDSLLSQALEDCSIALKNEPQHILGYQNRINIFLIRNQIKEALSDADSLIKYDPANPAGWLTRGIVYSRLNNTENAYTNLNKAISLNPSSDVALNLRATLLVNVYQKFSEALTDLNNAIGINARGDYFLSRSICYYRLGDMAHAKADAQTALQKGVVIQDSYRRLLNL